MSNLCPANEPSANVIVQLESEDGVPVGKASMAVSFATIESV